MGPGRLVAVNVVHAVRPDPGGRVGSTAIDKQAVEGRVMARRLGVAGDHVEDKQDHGGVHQAVYSYAREDAAWWEAELGRELPPGSFGENLSTEGLPVTDAVIGERWAVGDAVFEVSSPRIPCQTFARFWDVPRLVKRFTEHGAPGAYLRVLTEGEIGGGDEIRVVHRPEHGVTIGETFRGLTGDHSLAGRLLLAPELPPHRLEQVRKWLEPPARERTA